MHEESPKPLPVPRQDPDLSTLYNLPKYFKFFRNNAGIGIFHRYIGGMVLNPQIIQCSSPPPFYRGRL